MSDQPVSDFERLSSSAPRSGLLSDLWGFLRHNKKWWLLPMLTILLLFGLLMLLAGTAVAPFIYPLF
jgi:hypothetical protein